MPKTYLLVSSLPKYITVAVLRVHIRRRIAVLSGNRKVTGDNKTNPATRNEEFRHSPREFMNEKNSEPMCTWRNVLSAFTVSSVNKKKIKFITGIMLLSPTFRENVNYSTIYELPHSALKKGKLKRSSAYYIVP